MSDTLIKETQAAIERLMRWCGAKNKEPCLPLDERTFVMDIEMVYTEAAKHMQPGVPVSALEELAATWEAWSPRNPTEFEAGIEQGRYAAAVELRRAIKAIREPKPPASED